MSNTTEALAALHAAEAELEAALAAEKGVEPESGTAADEPVSAPVAVAEAPPVLGPEQIRVAKEFLSREDSPAAVVLTAEQIAAEKAAIQAYRDAGSPPPAPLEKPKWLVLPNYLGPIAINGT